MPTNTPPPVDAPINPEGITPKPWWRRYRWAILLLILVVLIGVGLWMALKPPTTPSTSVDVTQEEIVAPTVETPPVEVTPTVDEWLYTNSEYGFTLTFNELWSGYEVIKKPSDDPTATTYLYACVPTTDNSWSDVKNRVFCPFAMTVIERGAWADFVTANDPMIPLIIGQSESYIFAINSAQAHPTDGEAVLQDYTNVTKTFATTSSAVTSHADSTFKISFLYPQSWKLTTSTPSGGDLGSYYQADLASPDGDTMHIYVSAPGRGGPCLAYAFELQGTQGQVAVGTTSQLTADPDGMCQTNSPGVSGLYSDSAGTEVFTEYFADTKTSDAVYLERAKSILNTVIAQ